MDGQIGHLFVCLCVCAAWPSLLPTLPGARLTSLSRRLPAESWFASRQWPVVSLGSQMATAALGLRFQQIYFHLTSQ